MTAYVALLRGVNLVGKSTLRMADLKEIAVKLGLESVRTFIASGNLLFTSALGEAQVREKLETRLAPHMGRHVPVMVRTAAEVTAVARANPFKEAPGSRVLAIFLPDKPPKDALDQARGHDGERLALGKREIYVDYCGALLGRSKLKIPAAVSGTARNMNTVAKLAELAREMA